MTLALVAAATLVCIMLSIPRGIELADESAYIYLLQNPDTAIQYLDHRLWGPIGAAMGGGVAFHRGLALLLTVASALYVGRAALAVVFPAGSGGLSRPATATIYLLTTVGALSYWSAIRPTMNYGTTGLVFGNVFVGLLLHDLVRRDARRWHLMVPVGIGVSLALLSLGRFTAVPVGWAIVALYAVARPWSWSRAHRLSFVVASVAWTLAAMAALEWAGFDIRRMVRFGVAMGASSHRMADFLPRDIALSALVVGVGVVGGLVSWWLAGRVGGVRMPHATQRSFLITLFSAAVLLASVLDQRSVITGPAAGTSPFSTNVNLYGTTYGFFIVIAAFAMLIALAGRDRTDAADDRALWGTLALLAAASVFSFVGTNTGILARSALNLGPLFTAFAVVLRIGEQRGVLARWVADAVGVATAIVAALFVFLNTIWSPYNVNGAWTRQSVSLATPEALAGLRVSPGVARLESDLRRGLAVLGFDPARDLLLFDYSQPGLALLAGGTIAGPIYLSDIDATVPAKCAEIVAAVATDRPRRLYGLNLRYRAPLVRCLRASGIDLTAAVHVRVSPSLVISVVDPRVPG